MAPTGRGRTGLALTLAVSGGVVFSAVPVRRNQNDDGDREGPEQALAAAVLAAAGPLFAHGSKPDWPKMRQRLDEIEKRIKRVMKLLLERSAVVANDDIGP